MEVIASAPGYLDLLGSLNAISREDASATRTRRENAAADDLFNLGLLADTTAAALISSAVVDTGMMSVDPKLDMLRLNQTLPPRQDTAS